MHTPVLAFLLQTTIFDLKQTSLFHQQTRKNFVNQNYNQIQLLCHLRCGHQLGKYPNLIEYMQSMRIQVKVCRICQHLVNYLKYNRIFAEIRKVLSEIMTKTNKRIFLKLWPTQQLSSNIFYSSTTSAPDVYSLTLLTQNLYLSD